MKETYPDEIMLCFVQGFGDSERGYSKSRECPDQNKPRTDLHSKKSVKRVSLHLEEADQPVELRSKKSEGLLTGKSLRLSSGGRFPEVKRSLSDRFSVISDASSKKPAKGLLTIRKTWSTGNFASGAAGGGCGAPRSAPATPLQLEPHPRSAKHEKQAVKPLSGSAPSVRVSALGSVSGNDETKDSKQPSKARQKKFQRHFPQVGPEEKVLNYYSCALVGDLLLQGHLYITKNYFAFYSNVFGYVTKLLIPTTSVLRITKEKVARIIPNAVGVCTRDERHVFGSLLSRDSTYKLMMHVWKTARTPELAVPKAQDPRASEVDFEASEYSPEDDSSSAGGDQVDAPAAVRRESETILPTGAAVIQPALLTGSSTPKRRATHCWQFLLVAAVVLLALSALLLSYKLYQSKYAQEEDLTNLTGDELYSELVRWRQRLHGRAADELHSFLSTNLLLLTKVRQSLEALSGVIVDDLPPQDPARVVLDVPNDTAFS
ncbi:protein Aster-B-like isoform X2 [Bombyx mandarina]|uniref:Protein Aster-B-like isoform X2 n=1 Tax=Bombyx mandarina TaxID=7092 RepID=A0A6J2KBQ1_BOMMA|nr:protein Aster-B-like isoform X2 [Bombyx mandarina]